jgi:CRISPR-associated endonuclease/helicase Cas3
VPTRLSDETQTLYLALWRDGELHPLREDGAYCWEQSAVSINARHAQTLAADWQRRFADALQHLRSHHRVLEEPAFVLPLMEVDSQLTAKVQDDKGRELTMRYDRRDGLSW